MSKPIKLTVEISEEQVWAFAPFLKRVGFSDYRALASHDNEADLMRDVGVKVRMALEEPRDFTSLTVAT
jgi:hypothetical protein